MTGPVRAAYDQLIADGELKSDAAQERAVTALDRLAGSSDASGGILSRLFGSAPKGRAGAYLWGGVGRGKSMLMDLAFESIAIHPKRRVHFHEFMLETHARLRRIRERQAGDPIEPVAEEIAEEAKLLCFDEIQVTNPADAMILSRLFGKLIDAGVKVVTTSNRPPRDLYKGGLNRELFLPFIELIERRMLVVEVNGPTDYRLQRLAGVHVWHVPNGPEATAALSRAFFQLTDYPVEDRAKAAAGPCTSPRASRASRSFPSSACAESRAEPPIISRSRAGFTRSLSSASRSWGPRCATRRRASSP
jgi:cell division protein ZapE